MLLILLLSIVSHFPDWPHYPAPPDNLVPCVVPVPGVCIEDTDTGVEMLFGGFGLTYNEMEIELAPGGLYEDWMRATSLTLPAGRLSGLLGGNDPFGALVLYPKFYYFSTIAPSGDYAVVDSIYVNVADGGGDRIPWTLDDVLPGVPHALNRKPSQPALTETPEGSSLLLVGLGLLILAARRKSRNRTG